MLWLVLAIVIANLLFSYISKLIRKFRNPIFVTPETVFLPEEKNFGDIEFPDISPGSYFINEGDVAFTLDNEFPVFPAYIYVYEIIPPEKTFLTREEAANMASEYNLKIQIPPTSNTLTVWTNVDQSKRFEFNETSFTYKITSDFISQYDSLPGQKFSIEEENIKNKIISGIYDTLPRNNAKFDSQDATMYPILYSSTTPGPYPFAYEKQRSEVNGELVILHQNLDSLPISTENRSSKDDLVELYLPNSKLYFPEPILSNLFFVVSPSTNSAKDVAFLYYKPININEKENVGIYKIITPYEALENVKRGAANLRLVYKDDPFANLANLSPSEITIEAKQTELAYLVVDGGPLTYPIFIFRGTFEDTKGGGKYSAIFYVNALE